MKIVSSKIPMKMKALPELYLFLNNHGQKFTIELADILEKIQKPADSSNATWKQIAAEIEDCSWRTIRFDFYFSKNPFVGHNVISHARNMTVNYNTRFHSCSTLILPDWIDNFFHEATHLADQNSPLSFGHRDQKDKGAAPFIVGSMARQLYLSKEWR